MSLCIKQLCREALWVFKMHLSGAANEVRHVPLLTYLDMASLYSFSALATCSLKSSTLGLTSLAAGAAASLDSAMIDREGTGGKVIEDGDPLRRED